MNTHHFILALAAAMAFPVAGYAQEAGPAVTRAQVRAELVRLESVGYTPGRANDPHYPADIQAAEAAVASQGGVESNVNGSVGGVHSGSSASGLRATPHAPVNSLYAHH